MTPPAADQPPKPAGRVSKNPVIRGLWLALGLGFVALGFIGIFLPGLPTTPFQILAAACFSRSSERLENWLLEHKSFGPLLRDWRERGAIPKRAKWYSAIGMAFGLVIFLLTAAHRPWLIVAVVAVMLVGLIYVFTRPSS